MDAGFDAHLRVGDATVDERDADLLAAVDREGSLSAAADALDRSYSRAQKRVAALEAEAGSLVERTRGGADGGGSRLTDAGRDLLARYARLRAALADTAETESLVLRGPVVDRDGELVAVDTAIGRVRALCFEDADRVGATVRADAVTLHDPANAPPESGSSARNRFAGTVESLDDRESVALVHVAVDASAETNGDESAAATLPVLVTRASVDRLELDHGRKVVATFKATATRATPE